MPRSPTKTTLCRNLSGYQAESFSPVGNEPPEDNENAFRCHLRQGFELERSTGDRLPWDQYLGCFRGPSYASAQICGRIWKPELRIPCDGGSE